MNTEQHTKKDTLQEAFQSLLSEAGEDPNRSGLKETWQRRAPEMWQTLTEGYSEEAKPQMTTFAAEHEEMVMKTDIPFYSLCEHHLLPFFGKAHIAYVPDGEIAGLSKLIRYTRWRARRLHTQEELTQDLMNGLAEELDVDGVMVVTEAEHLCEAMRGVETPDISTVTTAARGVLADTTESKGPRTRFLQMIDMSDA